MKRPPEALMECAHSVTLYVAEQPEGWYGTTGYYLSPNRKISYRQRRPLKTKQGAIDRQRRETMQFLKDLRDQIDDVLVKLETAQIDEYDMMLVYSFAYKDE